jgi:hypothetical protein
VEPSTGAARPAPEPAAPESAAAASTPASTAVDALVGRAIEAARADDLETLRGLFDWPLTGGPRISRWLRDMDRADRAEVAADLWTGLEGAGESVLRPLRQLAHALATAESVAGTDPSERRMWQVQFEFAQVRPEGLSAEQQAQWTRLRERAAGLTEFRLVDCGWTVLPLAWASDTGRLVAVYT